MQMPVREKRKMTIKKRNEKLFIIYFIITGYNIILYILTISL